jgi:hypothetical protein
MRRIWRFFATDDGRWRWQQLTDDRMLIAQSALTYVDYEQCIASAQAAGYVYEAPQKRIARPGNAGFPWR